MKIIGRLSPGPRRQRSVAACLAAVLEVESGDVPVPDDEHPQPWTVWRNWLSQRGLGLIPVAQPESFAWPGPWLALLRAADGDGQIAAVAFGVPPGIVWHPFEGPETLEAIEAGYVVAPADVALWTPAPRPMSPQEGVVEAIMVAPLAEAELVRVQTARVHAGRGLEGDRYFEGRGTFSSAHGRGHDLTLIEAEVLEQTYFPNGRLQPEQARRNLLTRNIDLNALVGKKFRIGEVECFGQRLCEPCAHLERLTAAAGTPSTLRALIHKGGLRVDVLNSGEIRVGEPITRD